MVVGYGLVAFALLQVIEPIQHGLHLPDAMLTYVVVALGAGFPVVVTLGWAYEVTAKGIEPTPTVPGAAPSMRGVRLAVMLLGLGGGRRSTRACVVFHSARTCIGWGLE